MTTTDNSRPQAWIGAAVYPCDRGMPGSVRAALALARLADTLEAVTKERDWHRSQYERLLAERDELRAVISEALAEEECSTDQGTRMWRILSRIPEHPKEAD